MAERRGRMGAIAIELPRIAGRVLGARGLGEAQLLTQWASIIGPTLAEQVSPDRLSFPRGERRNGTLRLRVAPAVALEIQHTEPVILERINAFFGYRAVARLVLIQGPPTRPPRPRPPQRRPLTQAEQRLLDQRVESVDDSALREALARLGRAMLATPKP
jgi:hypothetical protein